MLWQLRNRIKTFIRLYITHDELFRARYEFKVANRTKDLRHEFPLTTDSVVLDIGGYKGEWAEEIVRRYDPHLYIFEPVEQYYQLIANKFKDNPKVRVFHYGLDGRNATETIYVDGDASSMYRGDGEAVSMQLRRVDEVLDELKLAQIDLLKINNEGGEYGVFDILLEKKLLTRINYLLISFHIFIEGAREQRATIQTGLEETHKIVFDYPFFSECWERK